MSKTFKIINGDIEYNVKGQPIYTSSDKEKVSQDLSECTIVPTDDIGFGMGIVDLVGSVQNPIQVPSLLQSKIIAGINNLINIQLKNQRLVRSNSELISSLASISAAPASSNGVVNFNFSYSVNTINGDAVNKKGTV